VQQRTRKLIGVPLLVGIVAVWAGVATLAYERWLSGAPWWLLAAYFAVAGLGWFAPAAVAIAWMQAPERDRPRDSP
jgi:hypothetical protein